MDLLPVTIVPSRLSITNWIYRCKTEPAKSEIIGFARKFTGSKIGQLLNYDHEHLDEHAGQSWVIATGAGAGVAQGWL